MSKNNIPRYTSIAIDIAHNILNDTYTVGEKIKGRSTLSSKYSVSPETIRKAIGLLREMDVVKVNEKSGIIVHSKEMAFIFIEKYNSEINIKLLYQQIKELQKEKSVLEEKISNNLDLILDYTLKYQKTVALETSTEGFDSIHTVCFMLEPEHFIIGKSIRETEFFKHTQATIVSIARENERILSPGPFFVFQPGDMLFLVCDDDNIDNVQKFIIDGKS